MLLQGKVNERKKEAIEAEDRLLQRENNIDRRDLALQNREAALEERENNLLEKQENAFEYLKKNANNLTLENVQLIKGDLFTFDFDELPMADLIVSNPP